MRVEGYGKDPAASWGDGEMPSYVTLSPGAARLGLESGVVEGRRDLRRAFQALVHNGLDSSMFLVIIQRLLSGASVWGTEEDAVQIAKGS